MVDVQTEIMMQRSREVVAAYTANPDNAPEWYVNIKSVEWQTSKPLRLGSRIAFKPVFWAASFQAKLILEGQNAK